MRVPQRGDKKALLETVARNAQRGADPAQAAPVRRPDHPQQGAGGDRRGARHGHGAAAHRVLRRLADPGHRRGRQHGRLRGRAAPQERVPAVRRRAAPPTTCPRSPRCCAGGSPATSTCAPRRASWATRRPSTRTGPASTRRPGGRASSRTRRSWSWSTAAQPQVNAAAAVLSDLGINDVALCGLAKRLEEVWLPDDEFPVDPAPHVARGSTCCSGSATRRTGSRSRSTGSGGRSG